MDKKYDLEERTLHFAVSSRLLISKIPKTIANIEDSKQLARATGSVGANYIEANESLSKKDFYYRIKICRKESKECNYWLQIIKRSNNFVNDLNEEISLLSKEANELKMIFSSILNNAKE